MITKNRNLLSSTSCSGKKAVLFATVLVGGFGMLSPKTADCGQSSVAAQSTTPARSAAAPAVARTGPVWHGYRMNRLSHRAEMYYEGAWGVDDLHIKVAESGELIRFNYRVVDPEKAAALNNKKVEPELLDVQAGVKLSIPPDGEGRKTAPEQHTSGGHDYWMAFSNPTLAVKRGHRVDVVIGSFRANNLVVE